MTRDSVKASVESITDDVREKAKSRKIKGENKRMNDHDELDDAQITKYRALVARANYLAVDRGDIAFCVKELARCMSSPSRQDWERLQRLARYPRHKRRCVLWYAYQGTTGEVTCFTDSDWAGCKRTRRSTSGGCMLCGVHVESDTGFGELVLGQRQSYTLQSRRVAKPWDSCQISKTIKFMPAVRS